MPRHFKRSSYVVEPDVAGEAAGVAGDVATAVIRKPFDRDGQAIDLAEPVLDGSHHQVAHVLAGDAAGRRRRPTAILGSRVGDRDDRRVLWGNHHALGWRGSGGGKHPVLSASRACTHQNPAVNA